MNTVEAIDNAIAAHAKWKWRLQEAIATGKSQWHVADVRTDRACEFGKWLRTLPPTQLLSVYCKQVRTLHAEFHLIAAEVLGLALAGRKAEATAAMGSGSRFLTVSSNLIMALSAWQKEQGRNRSSA
jgi:hypothetical protein